MAIWATNVPQWYITFWATTKIGAVLVTVNTAYKIHEAEYLLRQSDTHTLVMIDGSRFGLCGHHPRAVPRAPRTACPASSTPSGCRCCIMSSPSTAARRAATPEHAMGWATPLPPQRWRTAAARSAGTTMCNMQYTSRHHGLPKGGHAYPLQRGEQRQQGHRRLHGPLHR